MQFVCGGYTRPMHPAITRLFPSTVHVSECSDPALVEPLFPEEEAAIARAVEKRKVEFALGRTAARAALRALGVAPGPLVAQPDRSVGWPGEAWGSITHADGICLAAAVRRSDHAGVGIDAELRERVRQDLWSHIATEREIAWFRDGTDEREARARATLLFSAKETFYKAQFCVSRAWVGFHDAELTFGADGTFEVRLLVDVGDAFAREARFHGRSCLLDRHVVTGMVV